MLRFLRLVPQNVITKPVINQLVKSATSIGANYCEADDAESKKNFRHKVGIVKKECRESKHFLRMLLVLLPEERVNIEKLMREAKELNLIFNKIYHKVS